MFEGNGRARKDWTMLSSGRYARAMIAASKGAPVRCRWLAAMLAVLTAGGTGGAEEPVPVALELVLALDTSSSVTAAEFEIERDGLTQAFRHPDVLAAVAAAGDQGIAVTLIQWSGNRMQQRSIDWRVIRDEAGAVALSAAIAATPRAFTGSTGLGGAIRYALKEIESNGYAGRRKVIDVIGDGFTGLSPKRERDRAVARGVTINGLAILDENPELGRYYADHVIGGPGAFVLTVRSVRDFAEAVRDKLIREIGSLKLAGPAGSGQF